MTEQDGYEARRAKVAEQVKLLLAKAAGTDSEHERETFENAAAVKMRRWLINEAELRAGMGYAAAGDILEEIFPLAWQDGNGMERGQLAGCAARPFGVETVIQGSAPDMIMQPMGEPSYPTDVRVSLNGTRAALDAVLALLPELLVQCDAAAVRAWDARLYERAAVHDDRRRERETFSSRVGYGWSASSPYGYGLTGGPVQPGTCTCGCGMPTDDGTYPGSGYVSPYSEMMRMLDETYLYGKPSQPAVGSAAERLEKERRGFVKSFMGGFAQHVEERLNKANKIAAETPQEQEEADRAALVLKSDADRAAEEVKRRFPFTDTVTSDMPDLAARQAGYSDASGADLGGRRFDGYGARGELGA